MPKLKIVARGTKEIGEKLSMHICLESDDQRKNVIIMKGLEKKKCLESNQFPKTLAKSRGASSSYDRQKSEKVCE